MPSERQRILGLALESLENKKRKIEEEIAALIGELRTDPAARRVTFNDIDGSEAQREFRSRKRSRFSRAERARRSARMKAFWAKWRKNRARQK